MFMQAQDQNEDKVSGHRKQVVQRMRGPENQFHDILNEIKSFTFSLIFPDKYIIS